MLGFLLRPLPLCLLFSALRRPEYRAYRAHCERGRRGVTGREGGTNRESSEGREGGEIRERETETVTEEGEKTTEGGGDLTHEEDEEDSDGDESTVEAGDDGSRIRVCYPAVRGEEDPA